MDFTTSPDGRLQAAYGIVAVNSGHASGFYGPQFRSPATFALFLSGQLFGGQANASAPGPLSFGFRLLDWRTANGFSGYTMFRTFPLPADPRGYIVAMDVAGGPTSAGKASLAPAAMTAASIRCNVQLRPPPPTIFVRRTEPLASAESAGRVTPPDEITTRFWEPNTFTIAPATTTTSGKKTGWKTARRVPAIIKRPATISSSSNMC